MKGYASAGRSLRRIPGLRNLVRMLDVGWDGY